ncbi:MAG: SpoIID/LytB domain-containing protein [Eisenbergiella sp.]
MQERELEKRAAGAVRRKRMQDLLTVLLFMLLLPYTCSVVVRSGSGQAVETLSVGAEQEGILWEYGNGSRRLSEEEFLTGALAGCIPAQYREETLKARAVILRSNLYAEGKKGAGGAERKKMIRLVSSASARRRAVLHGFRRRSAEGCGERTLRSWNKSAAGL